MTTTSSLYLPPILCIQGASRALFNRQSSHLYCPFDNIIKANKCLRYQYGPPRKGTFNNIDVRVTKGEPTQIVSPKKALKARVAAHKEAIEEVAKVAAEAVANAVVEAPPGELGGPGKPAAIEPNDDEGKSHDEGAYAALKEAIEVEDYEASYIEAL